MNTSLESLLEDKDPDAFRGISERFQHAILCALLEDKSDLVDRVMVSIKVAKESLGKVGIGKQYSVYMHTLQKFLFQGVSMVCANR